MFKKNSKDVSSTLDLDSSISTVSETESFTSSVDCSNDSSPSYYQDNKDEEISIILNNIMQNKKAEEIFQGSTKKIEDIINMRIHNDMGFLHYAALVDNTSVVEALIEKSANINLLDNTDSTPLHYAHSVDVAKLLINANADINAQNNQKRDILTIAYILDNVDLLEYLIKDTDIDVKSTKAYFRIPESTTNDTMLKNMLGVVLYGDEWCDFHE